MSKQNTSSKEWPGAFETYSRVIKQMNLNWKPVAFFVGVYTLMTAVSLSLQGKSVYTDTSYVPYSDAVLILFLLPIVSFALAVAKRKTMTIDQFMTITPRTFLLLMVTSIFASAIILGSILLFIIPAIWTVAWFTLSTYAMVDKNLSPIESLKRSKQVSKDHKAKVWGVIGVGMLLSLVAALFAGIPYIGIAGIAYATIALSAASAELYLWLDSQPIKTIK